jgi:hypothetical protein
MQNIGAPPIGNSLRKNPFYLGHGVLWVPFLGLCSTNVQMIGLYMCGKGYPYYSTYTLEVCVKSREEVSLLFEFMHKSKCEKLWEFRIIWEIIL